MKENSTYRTASPDHEVVAPVRSFQKKAEGYRWEGVSPLAYKPEGTHFKGITRQVLFGDADDLTSQLRYFEIEPGGYSTLERHTHVHAVMILRGTGRVLVGEAIYPLVPYDLVYIPPQTWHQFRAANQDPLGFLCLVACDRDRPIRPTPAEVQALQTHPNITDFIRL